MSAMKVADIIKQGGGVAAVARALGIHHTSVIGWCQADRIPAERCAAVNAITHVPLHEIRPDVYPVPSTTPAREDAA